MTKTEVHRQALQLPERERLQLAEELWSSIDDANAYADALPVSQWQEDLLDERLEETKNDPGKPWEQVKAEIWPGRSGRSALASAQLLSGISRRRRTGMQSSRFPTSTSVSSASWSRCYNRLRVSQPILP